MMTTDQKLDQVIFSTKMGGIRPLWGIVMSKYGRRQCECPFGILCEHPGKHPRNSSFNQEAEMQGKLPSVDPGQIIAWHKIYPYANYGVHPRQVPQDYVQDPKRPKLGIVAFDLDHRPEQGKYGPSDLELLAEWNGEPMPETISVRSGRNDFSRHDYFRIPRGFKPENLISHFPAIEIKLNGYCVAPGSMHLSGNIYRFSEECSPLAMRKVLELPAWMVNNFYEEPEEEDLPWAGLTREVGNQQEPDGAISPGIYRPDEVVMQLMKNDRVAGDIMNGAYSGDRSKKDHVLFCKLAFYTSHHWKQYIRLAVLLPISKSSTWEDYVARTVDRAFVACRNNCMRKTKEPYCGPNHGRSQSLDTKAVIRAITDTPSLKASDIAFALGLLASKVRNILSRYRKGFYLTN